jgi:hypothetical protein
MFAIVTPQWHREGMSKGMWWTRYALALDNLSAGRRSDFRFLNAE